MTKPVDTTPDAARITLAQSLLGHDFARPELLREALTHRSAAHARSHGRTRMVTPSSNERLEFIGDRVLGLLVAEWLAERFPTEQEGQLGPRHAHLVNRDTLAGIAEEIGFSRVLKLGGPEALAGVGKLANVLADAMEAALGALYLDAGLDAARAFVRRAWDGAMQAQVLPPKDAKTALQEYLLARSLPLPDYKVLSNAGPSHAPIFIVTATGAGQTGTGEAGSKRAAERLAAEDLLRKLT